MGFVTNRWQPVNSGPGPIPVPTWERIKNGVTATTNFDFSNLDYTEYLIIVYANNTTNFYQFFVIPEMNTNQRAGYTNVDVYMNTVNGNSNQRSFTIYSGSSTVTKNWKYTVYGRKKAAWSLVSNNSALPNYTELITGNGYYTPFNYQENMYRANGGSHPSYTTYSAQNDKIYNNAFTSSSGWSTAYTRLSTTEASWNHIQSAPSTAPTHTVSIENITWSEMFIVGKRIGPNNYQFQAVYLISEMTKGTFNAGGCTRYQSNTANEWRTGYISVSDTTVTAHYEYRTNNTTTYTTQSIDIYYR